MGVVNNNGLSARAAFFYFGNVLGYYLLLLFGNECIGGDEQGFVQVGK
jgi:hypothetical protein